MNYFIKDKLNYPVCMPFVSTTGIIEVDSDPSRRVGDIFHIARACDHRVSLVSWEALLHSSAPATPYFSLDLNRDFCVCSCVGYIASKQANVILNP